MFNENNMMALIAVFFVALVLGFFIFPSQPFCGSLAGHFLGIAGTIIMLLTLIYPFRKRVQGKKGKKNPINTHIYYGLIGPSLVVLHSGHDFSSLIGNFTFLSMLLVVLSGIVGKFLFKRVNRTLRDEENDLAALERLFQKRKDETAVLGCRMYLGLENAELQEGAAGTVFSYQDTGEVAEEGCRELVDIARSMAEREHAIEAYTATKNLFSRWIRMHIYLTVFLFAMILVHILTTVYYGLRWI